MLLELKKITPKTKTLTKQRASWLIACHFYFENKNEITASTMKSTPSSAQKPKRNFLTEFLPLYRKSGESYAKESVDESENLKFSSNKIQTDSPKRQRPSSKKGNQVKQLVEVTQIIIDGSNLSPRGAGSNSPVDKSKVTSSSPANKKPAKSKKNASAIELRETTEKVSLNHSKSSNKRSKSLSAQKDENDQAVVKKHKSINSHEEATGNNKVHKTTNQDKTSKSSKVSEKTKKPKKQKHQKEPKSEIDNLDNLESLNLGDNFHTFSNLIDEMAVVDKAKLKKLRKTANREKKQENQQESCDTNQDVSDTGDAGISGETVEKKKWACKRWNKHQIAKRDMDTAVNVDNLPVSLLKGNYQKVIIDHFSKYGLSRSVGVPIIYNEDDPNSVFTTKVFFDTAEAAAQALEMDDSIIAGKKIAVTQMRALSETGVVLRIYGPIEKLANKDIIALFRDEGPIRSIRHLLKKKNTMSTVVVEFDRVETVDHVLMKCADLTINGVKLIADRFEILNRDQKELRMRHKEIKTTKRKRQRSSKKATKKINKSN